VETEHARIGLVFAIMDQTLIERHLAEVEEHVALGLKHVMVAALRRRKFDEGAIAADDARLRMPSAIHSSRSAKMLARSGSAAS
jgi:hypothetical protein